MKTCSIKGCEKPVRVRGLCSAHYTRLLDGKDMSAPMRKVIRGMSDIDRLKAHTVANEQTGCWEWTASLTEHGYGQMRFRGTRWLSHRVAWVLFKGEIPEDGNAYKTMGVLHRCDNPKCVNPEHLFLGDQGDNCTDSVSKSRWGKRGCPGETHGRAIVTEDMVREIRRSEETLSVLAERYGLSRSAVSHIRKRRSWTHVE